MNGIVPQLETAAKTNAHDDRKLVRKGDFAINSRSDRRGSCGISEYDGSVSLINTILAPLGEMNPNYYNWLFHTTQFADEFYKGLQFSIIPRTQEVLQAIVQNCFSFSSYCTALLKQLSYAFRRRKFKFHKLCFQFFTWR